MLKQPEFFYKNGYEQTTVEDIINASKTSKGTFYHYFKGKEALLNSLSYLFDQKYEDLAAVIDPNLSCYDKLLFLNHELFYMIETSIDIHLLAYLYSSQLVTKDKKSLSDKKRIYFKWLTEIMEEGLKNGEFKNTSTASELMEIYAMYERALLYDGPFQRQILTDRTYRQVTSTCITDICGWTLIAMYSKEAASFPYIKKLQVLTAEISLQSTPVLFSPDFPYPCYDLLYKAFMNIFLFNPYLFHHIKDLFSVCQIRTPGKSASCRNRSRYRNQSAWYISFLAYLLHRHRIRRRMESYNKFHYFFS